MASESRSGWDMAVTRRTIKPSRDAPATANSPTPIQIRLPSYVDSTGSDSSESPWASTHRDTTRGQPGHWAAAGQVSVTVAQVGPPEAVVRAASYWAVRKVNGPRLRRSHKRWPVRNFDQVT